jgi:hypothetical protein
VNTLGLDTLLVLDHKLEKILWSMHLGGTTHDVKMQENGFLLIYRNRQPGFPTPDYSSIEELNPITNEKRVLYKANPPESFFSHAWGGTQWLPNGNLLISDVSHGGKALEIDSKGKIIWSINYPNLNPSTGLPDIYQQVRRLDFSGFLQNYKGP